MKLRKRHLLDLGGASLASVAATLVDALIYFVLLWTIVRNTGVSVGVAAGIAALFGGAVHFGLSRFWVFGRFDAPLKQSAAIYFIVSWFAALAHGAFTTLLVGVMGTVAGASIGWIISKGAIWVLWTYPLSRYVVFGGLGARHKKSARDEDRED